jgi:hypothetical protein
MTTQTRAPLLWVALFVAALTLACASTAQVRQTNNADNASAADYTVSGPYTHKNLSVFLIRTKDKTTDGKNFLTLREALEQKKVVVYETKNVNELSIENVSGEEVFVQSGDIVKGGQQDRMLGVDLVVPAHSGRVAISAFCVEHGRWTRRGAEAAAQFTTSTDRAATKDLKLAAKRSKSQMEVWQKVEEAQTKLSHNVGGAVNSAASPSSLQLSLENPKVQATADEYTKALSSAPASDADVVGYAFAVNGEINSAEIYGSHALFMKLWSGLLKSSAVEAVAELQTDAKPAPVPADEVRAFLAESEKGDASREDVGARVQLVTRESKSNIMFETRSSSGSGGGAASPKMVHKSYIKKE